MMWEGVSGIQDDISAVPERHFFLRFYVPSERPSLSNGPIIATCLVKIVKRRPLSLLPHTNTNTTKSIK